MFMVSNATYQQVCPGLTRKTWSVLSPDDEGRGPHTCNTSGISFHRATNILVLSREKTCNICYMTFFKKIKNTFNSLKASVFYDMSHIFISDKGMQNVLLYVDLCFQIKVINIQNWCTRVWYDSFGRAI